MRHIQLTRDQIAIVSEADYECISQFNWQFHHSGYATRNIPQWIDGKYSQKQVYMHRVIMNAQRGQQVDHINGDKLDNRRDNLRFCTNAQNQQNRRLYRTFKGISWHIRKKKYIAHIQVDGKLLHLGYFATAEDAASAYDRAAIIHFGQFAHLNSGGHQG